MLIRKTRVPIVTMLTVGLLPSALKVLWYRMRGYRIGPRVSLGPLTVVIGKDVEIGEGTEIGFATILRGEQIRIGRFVKIGAMTFFDVRRFEIGDDAKINEQVYAGGPMLPESYLKLGKRTIVMQYSFLNPTKPLVVGDDTGIGGHCLLFTHGSWQSQLEGYPVTFAPITLGNNVWLPWRVFIMPGVTVGDGTTIGANSLVVEDLPAHCLAAGSPAKVLRGPEGYPPPLEPDVKVRLVRDIFGEFKRYLEAHEFGVTESTNGSSLTFTVQHDNRPRGALLLALDGAVPRVPDGDTAVFGFFGTEPASELGSAPMAVNFDARTRRGSTPAGEEAVLFLSRYGLRFERED